MLKYIFFVLFVICKVDGIYRLNTENISWIVYNDFGNISVGAKLPGGVYGSLMEAGILVEGGFYYGYNDVNYRYVSYQNWTYKSCFEINEELEISNKIALQFEGLDTISNVVFDDVKIGSTDNMFVSYDFDITQLIKKQKNHCMKIGFTSPTEWSKKVYETQAENYPVLPDCVPKDYHGECHANHIRKMQASFAWDWGPAFPDMGIWKPWYIVGWNSALIKNIIFWTNPIENKFGQTLYSDWNVHVKVIFDLAETHKLISGTIIIKLDGEKKMEKKLHLYNHESEVISVESFIVGKEEIELWWPNGYGKQMLYNLEVSWLSDNGETDVKNVTVGFRKIELDQSFVNPDNTTLGRHFRVKVNNVNMFLKGSNWIPAHVLPTSVTDDYTIQLLQDAALTHQNCIRVWGGGIYESDIFYETADRLGILIWQDFMFACSMYPSSDWFLDTVAKEVRSQVRRLQSHSSIFLWAANNENEAALVGNWYGTQSNFNQYKEDYIRLYVDQIWTTLLEEDQSREFLTSSPTNGIESVEEGYIAANPYDARYGDVHYYNYFADAWKPETYPMTRFASEYGFQSWPSFRTFSAVLAEDDWNIKSKMMSHRQHHPFGQMELATQILTHFNFDFDSNTTTTFKNYLYLTQIHQAMAIKTETEYYLRQRTIINEKGEGLTSGALYWQLNDIWQGASWSSIEYGGRWKILHNFALKFFDQVLISPVINNDMIHIYIVNDRINSLENVAVKMCLRSYLHMEDLLCFSIEVSKLKPVSATLVGTYDLKKDFLLNEHCTFTSFDPVDTCFLLFSMIDNQGISHTWDNFLLLGEPKDAALKTAHIEITNISEVSSNDCMIELATNNVALFVWLETDQPGYFIDNGFIMTEISKNVLFHSQTKISCDTFVDSVEIKSLTDTYEIDNRLDNMVI